MTLTICTGIDLLLYGDECRGSQTTGSSVRIETVQLWGRRLRQKCKYLRCALSNCVQVVVMVPEPICAHSYSVSRLILDILSFCSNADTGSRRKYWHRKALS